MYDSPYQGDYAMCGGEFYGFLIQSLSQSDATKEILLIEEDSYLRAPWQTNSLCYTHVALYESDFLNRTDLWSLPPIEIDNDAFTQRGLFVFHSAYGLHRYLISRVQGAPTSPYYLTVLQ